MFGKLYFLGTGLMLLLIGTGLSFVEGMISETCDKISSMSQGIAIAFNPCDVFAMLPTAAIVMQVMGALIIGVILFFIVKNYKKPKLICPNCKERAPEKSAFCSKCGTKLEKEIKTAKPKK